MNYVNKLRFKEFEQKSSAISNIQTDCTQAGSNILTGQDLGNIGCNLSGIDQCKVGYFTEKQLNEKYFQNPDNLISILSKIENTNISNKN